MAPFEVRKSGLVAYKMFVSSPFAFYLMIFTFGAIAASVLNVRGARLPFCRRRGVSSTPFDQWPSDGLERPDECGIRK